MPHTLQPRMFIQWTPTKNYHVQSPQTHLPVLTFGNQTSKSSIVHLFIQKKQSLPIANTYTLWLFNVAIGNGPFIKMLYLFKNGGIWWIFPWQTAKYCNQMEKTSSHLRFSAVDHPSRSSQGPTRAIRRAELHDLLALMHDEGSLHAAFQRLSQVDPVVAFGGIIATWRFIKKRAIWKFAMVTPWIFFGGNTINFERSLPKIPWVLHIFSIYGCSEGKFSQHSQLRALTLCVALF